MVVVDVIEMTTMMVGDGSEFLRELESRCSITPVHATSVRRWWAALQQIEPALPLPVAHRTSDGALQFAWSYASLLLEFDVSEAGDAYWFGRNRESGAYEDGTVALDSVSDALKSWLERAADA